MPSPFSPKTLSPVKSFLDRYSVANLVRKCTRWPSAKILNNNSSKPSGKTHFPPPASGLTMIELLIVLAILSVLIVTLYGVIDPIAKIKLGRTTKTAADAEEISKAMNRYYIEHGVYPGLSDNRPADVIDPAGTSHVPTPVPPDTDALSTLIREQELKPIQPVSANGTISDASYMFATYQTFDSYSAEEPGDYPCVGNHPLTTSPTKVCTVAPASQALDPAQNSTLYGICENGGYIVGLVPCDNPTVQINLKYSTPLKPNDSSYLYRCYTCY